MEYTLLEFILCNQPIRRLLNVFPPQFPAGLVGCQTDILGLLLYRYRSSSPFASPHAKETFGLLALQYFWCLRNPLPLFSLFSSQEMGFTCGGLYLLWGFHIRFVFYHKIQLSCQKPLPHLLPPLPTPPHPPLCHAPSEVCQSPSERTAT